MIWRFLRSFLAEAITSTSLSNGDCAVYQRPESGFLSRVAPAPDADGVVLVWQESESIFLKRYNRDCDDRGGGQIEVNRTRRFWVEPSENGLGDAAGLGGGATAVAWTVDGDVWVRVARPSPGDAGGGLGPLVRASGPDRYQRTDVRIVANPDAGGIFVVAWSSWDQDGDGWGVYARPFGPDGQPTGPERQLNVEWRHFQWQPQLAWCGHTLWAIWANGTGTSCSEDGTTGADCATGPFLRQVGADGNMSEMGAEINLTGTGPISAALSCDEAAKKAAVVWLDDGGKFIEWNYRDPEGGRPPATAEGAASPPAGARGGRASAPARPRAWKPIAALGHSPGLTTDSLGAAAAAGVTMVADKGVVVILTSDGYGTLDAQLLDYSPVNGGVIFPEHHLGNYVQFLRAAWDVGDDRALYVCWTIGGSIVDPSPNAFICLRRSLQWLMNADTSTDDVLLMFALTAAASFFVIFCCCKPCLRNSLRGGRGTARRSTLRRLAAQRQRPERRAPPAPQLRELREQLVQIPMVPVNPPPGDSASDADPGAASDSTSAGGESSARMGVGNVCPICQNEVPMRVAFRPCGHTACRDCVHQVVEINQTCHICRGPIEGVLPVYI
mmetsp:Transcript_43505/g.123104  ORF Transcript_43505/g.123104 Transcript_43505/m.123104 type:complete len:612 (+) Transcript_43505:123-1958(+)